MSKTPPSQGKGSGRRKENAAKVCANWDSIAWTKRPVTKPSAPNATLSISDLDKMREV